MALKRVIHFLHQFNEKVQQGRFPGQRKPVTITAPASLTGQVLTGYRTVYETAVPGWHGGQPCQVLLTKVLDADRLNHETVEVIRLMDGQLWPQYHAKVEPKNLAYVGSLVEVVFERAPLHLKPA